MKIKNYLVIFTVCLLMFGFASAETFGYGNTPETPINYSLIPTVNNSQYLQGYTPQGIIDNFGLWKLQDGIQLTPINSSYDLILDGFLSVNEIGTTGGVIIGDVLSVVGYTFFGNNVTFAKSISVLDNLEADTMTLNETTIDDWSDITTNVSNLVPYTGATSNVDLGTHDLTTTGQINLNNAVIKQYPSNSIVSGKGSAGNLIDTSDSAIVGSRNAILLTSGHNYILGDYNLRKNTVHTGNVVLGYNNGNIDVVASSILIGRYAGSPQTTSVLIGQYAGRYINDGSDTVIIGGSNAGKNYGTGSSQLTNLDDGILIGGNTRPLNNNDVNEIVIGVDAVGHGSNTATIGGVSITDIYFNGNIETDDNLSIGGDTTFDGDLNTTGIVYESTTAKAYAQTDWHNVTDPITISFSGQNVYENITGLHLAYNNSIHINIATNQAVIEKTNMYQLTGSITFSGGNSGLYRFNLFKNGEEEHACGSMRSTSSNAYGSMSINCLVYLEEGDELNMRVEDTETPVQDAEIYLLTFNMVEI